MLFPRAIPGIIIGIGFFWVFVLVNPPGERAAQQHLGNHAGAQRPLAHARLLRHVRSLATVSDSLDDAARSGGASWWTTMTRIILPIVRPALFVSFILLFVSILNDYDPALFLVTPGNEIMGVTMLQTLQPGHDRAGRGACHGPGRDHRRRDRGRRPAVHHPRSEEAKCLRSPSRA